MEYTKNYNFALPGASDDVDVMVLNSNFKKVENQLIRIWLLLKKGTHIVSVKYSTDDISAELTDTTKSAPSLINDRLCMYADIGINAEIYISDNVYAAISELNKEIQVFGFNSVSEQQSSFTGRYCPIYLEYNVTNESITISADVGKMGKSDIYSENDNIYICLGTLKFDWDKNTGISNEIWEFNEVLQNDVTIDFSNSEEV